MKSFFIEEFYLKSLPSSPLFYIPLWTKHSKNLKKYIYEVCFFGKFKKNNNKDKRFQGKD